MKNLSRIFLIGAMGCGKTTVGQALAKQLGWEFIDIDRVCEAHTGKSITQIFADEGEKAFRKYEAAQIAERSSGNKIVLATGGGAILMPENRYHLQTRGNVIFLDASIETQAAHIKNDNSRPLLANSNPYETLQRLYCERKPLYQKIADFKVSVDHQLPIQIADKILSLLRLGT